MRLPSLASDLIDFCYPPVCVACDDAIAHASRASLCESCENDLARLEHEFFCDRCGVPLVELDDPCAFCLGKGVPHLERIVRLGTFRDPLKHLIHQMKYHRKWAIAELLARRLVDHQPTKSLLTATDVLIPIPLHPFREISRGYNQADVIARGIGAACKTKIARPLLRVRRTPMQTAMPSPAKRTENMQDAFALAEGKSIVGKRVVLVDDVMTTGATLQSAAKALAPAKPESVSALLIAVADPKHQDFQSI